MDEPVDVIIPYSPAHTDSDLLDRAKESVEMQAVDTNLIVVEDAEQHGPAWARNRGIERAESRYIAFLDADDRWHEGKLNKQLDALETEDVGMSVTKSRSGETVNDPCFRDEEFLRNVFLERATSFTSTILVDTDRAPDARFDKELYRREDHLYAIEVASEIGVAPVDEVLCTIEKRPGGLSDMEEIDRKFAAQQEFYDKALNASPSLKRYRRHFWHHVHHRTGRDLYYAGRYSESVNHLKKALKYRLTPKTIGALVISLVRSIR